jgi:CRP-like cAMP-binding protein
MPTTPKALLQMLKTFPLLVDCSPRELREIANLGTQLRVEDGTVLTRQDDRAREFCLIVSGRANCLVNGSQVATFESGDFFGEMALLGSGPRLATVIADGPMELIVLDTREFNDLVQASPSISRKLLTALASRARENAGARAAKPGAAGT